MITCVDGPPLDRGLRVNLQFHPDRISNGRTVLQHLSADGRYRSQFETGTSNGGLTAHPGGDRWRWERRIFGGAYDDAPPADRPKYGALNHRRRSIGAAPRFGSSFLRLAADVLDRTTFCFPDSVFEPTAFSTAARFGLFPMVDAFDAIDRTDSIEAAEGGLLDDYIEAHIHGPVDLASDVEALVLDPCYRGSAIQEQAEALGIPVEWHDGFQVSVDEVLRHPDFRGAHVVEVATALADRGRLDARIVGDAVSQGRHHPQDLKKVWHYVARYGWHW
jgi:hypothetical protein